MKNQKIKGIIQIAALTLAFQPFTAIGYTGTGDKLVKIADSSAVYVVTAGKRYVFPDSKTYRSWHGDDFSTVQTIGLEEMYTYPITGNVTHKPGSLIKITTDPKVYEVLDDAGTIQWVESEAVATQRFGAGWAGLIADVPDSFFVNYQIKEQGQSPITQTPPTAPPQPSNETGFLRLTSNILKDTVTATAPSDQNVAVVWEERTPAKLGSKFAIFNSQSLSSPVNLGNADFKTVSQPHVLWDGANYAVTWLGIKPIDSAPYFHYGIYLTKFTKAGEIVIENILLKDVSEGTEFDMATNQNHYALVSAETPLGEEALEFNKEIYFQKMDLSGYRLGSVERISYTDDLLPYPEDFSGQPDILWNGSSYGLFWTDHRDMQSSSDRGEIYFTELTTDGGKLVGETRLTSGSQSTRPQAVWDGIGYGVAYLLDGQLAFRTIYSTGVHRAGAPTLLGTKAHNSMTAPAIQLMNNTYRILAADTPADAAPADGTEIYEYKLDVEQQLIASQRLTYDPADSAHPVSLIQDGMLRMFWTDSRGCSTCQGETNGQYAEEIWYAPVP